MILTDDALFLISQKDLRFFEAVPSDLDGIVSQLRQTAGVETAIFFMKWNRILYKVSLRLERKRGCQPDCEIFRRRRSLAAGGRDDERNGSRCDQ